MVFGKHINKYYLKYWFLLVLGIASLVAVDYFQLKIPEIYRVVINGVKDGVVVGSDGVSVSFDGAYLWSGVAVPMLIVIAVMVVGRFLWRICFFGTATRVERDLRREMFEYCRHLPLEYYHTNKVGNLMSLFISDIDTLQDVFGSGFLVFCDALFLGGLALYKMFKMNVTLSLLTLIPIALMLTISIVLGRSIEHKWDKRQQAFADLSDFSQEIFSGIAVVKAFVREMAELMSFRKLNEQNEYWNVDYTKTQTTMKILITLLVESVVCIILGYGGYLVHEGQFDSGMLMEYIGYFTAIVWPIMAVTDLIDLVSRGNASLKRVSELLDAPLIVVDKAGAEDITNVKGKIEFKNFTFRYPGSDHDVIHNVSFVINAGENVGIVGKTGSGKTTIADVILRCYNVPEGQVFVDDKDVNDVTIKSLRQNCSYVPQDNFLFSDTIHNNVAFAVGQAQAEVVERYSAMAVVHNDIVDFSDGYQTVLGERGVTVSGGQKQRISIARALIKNSPVLILDDAVSAVDTDTERTILNAVRTERHGKTTVWIAHRISTVENLDKIVCLDHGKVVDVGTHKQLYERCAVYREMVDLQRLDDEKEGL